MAMSVSCSPNPLVSLSSAATRPTFSAPRYVPIICSKRKKKASAKPKILPPSKPSNLKLTQHEDILLGIGGGASTLTALQPRLDEDDPLLQRQQLELHLAHERLLQKLPEDPLAQQSLDPLSRYTFAAYESSDAGISKVCGTADELEDDDDDDEEEFEWVEINAEDDEDDDEENDEEGEDRYVYWGGDLGPMTEEEEAKLLCEAEKELTQLEREKRNANKWVASCGHLAQDADDGEEETEEGEEEEPDSVVYKGRNEEEVDHSSDYSETDEVEEDTLFSEAEAELAQFEARAWKLNYAERSHAVDSLKQKPIYSSNKKKLQDSHTSLENETTETLDDEEDEAAFIARITKEIEAEGRRGGKTLDVKGREKLQKRAIPAVMRSFDKAKIYVKSGNGGNGIVAFRREKYVPFGGPCGGSGGRGGNIYVEADPSINSLLTFRKSVHFRAGRGSHGLGKSQDGAAGVDCTIKVPLGTVIREAGDDLSGSGKVLLELTRPEQRELLLLGGRGGRGNTSFKTGRNKTPQLAENGEEGPEMWLELELKLVADVGIIGVPNAGKSTLLSVISAAQPAIAAYPFTTLLPNLGVVPIGFESSMVVADLPGLLEGAHLGIGLGHEFLRHTERCRVLVLMVDGMSQQPEEEYEAVRLELQLFNPALSEKPCIIAFNKMDIPEAAEHWKNFQAYLKEKGIEPICISAATKMGTIEVINKAYSLLQSLPRSPYENDTGDGSQIAGEELAVGEIIRRQHSASIEEFEIFGDTESKTWQVQGVGLERFTQMTNWEYFEALRRFQHVLNVSGVNKALRQRGVCEGDTVAVGEMEFVWHDSEDVRATEWKRGFRGSRIWPH